MATTGRIRLVRDSAFFRRVEYRGLDRHSPYWRPKTLRPPPPPSIPVSSSKILPNQVQTVNSENLEQVSASGRIRRLFIGPSAAVKIRNATFYRNHPASTQGKATSNPPLFPKLNFALNPGFGLHYAVIGPSSSGKTTFLQILKGQHICIPPNARTFNRLDISDKGSPESQIELVGFDGEQGLGEAAPQSAYLSARYESRRESTDFTLLDYLYGRTELNPDKANGGQIWNGRSQPKEYSEWVAKILEDLKLQELVDLPVSSLSNGQTRRARIAKALMKIPHVLLLDEPFMGLDPKNVRSLSAMLEKLATTAKPQVLISLRPQDPIPNWITTVICLQNSCQIEYRGKKRDMPAHLHARHTYEEPSSLTTKDGSGANKETTVEAGFSEPLLSRDGFPMVDTEPPEIGEPLVEMEGVQVKYGEKSVLGQWEQKINGQAEPQKGLWWTIRRGERWGVFGPNGSGKTTLLSLICSDHPQTYSLPIRIFGRSRLPEPGRPGISIFNLQSRIGHASPEVHSHIPKSLTLRQVLENAWADTFRGVPRLDENANERVDAALRWFMGQLRPATDIVKGNEKTKTDWANHLIFGGLPLTAQKVALFLRAVIKSPDLVILDEAFSGMDSFVRDKCLRFLAHGQTKRFSAKNNRLNSPLKETKLSRDGQVKIPGLSKEQALICISHDKSEIPGSVRDWICLPEAFTKEPARVGRSEGPIGLGKKRWDEIWGLVEEKETEKGTENIMEKRKQKLMEWRREKQEKKRMEKERREKILEEGMHDGIQKGITIKRLNLALPTDA